MAPITVEITAKAHDQGAQLQRGAGIDADPSPITFECEMSPQADSYGEAIVHALRKSADTAANRLGIVGEDERAVPAAVSQVIEEMGEVIAAGCETADWSLVLSWARALAGEYGLILTSDAKQLGSTIEA